MSHTYLSSIFLIIRKNYKLQLLTLFQVNFVHF